MFVKYQVFTDRSDRQNALHAVKKLTGGYAIVLSTIQTSSRLEIKLLHYGSIFGLVK